MILAHFGLVPTVLLFSGLTDESGVPAPDDTMTVFCLAPDHRPRLVAAAAALSLATPAPSSPDQVLVDNKPTDLKTWRKNHKADFDRVCRALIASEPQVRVVESKGFWVRMGEILVPAAFGALVTFAATGWRAAVDRGARDADALRAAAADFRGAFMAYVSEWSRGGDPAAVTVQLRRADLIKQIGRVISFHPSWPRPKKLKERAAGTELAEGDATSWAGIRVTERPAEVDRLRSSLDQFDADVEVVAVALSRPIRAGLPGSGIRRALK